MVSRLHFTGGHAPRSVREVLRNAATSSDPHEQTERQTAVKWLTDYLTATDKAASAEVKKAATKAGFSERTLARARVQLQVHVTDEGFPRTSYWSLPVTDAGRAIQVGTTSGTTAGGTTDEMPSELQTPTPTRGRSIQSCHARTDGTTDNTSTDATTDCESLGLADRWRISGEPVPAPPIALELAGTANSPQHQAHNRRHDSNAGDRP